jgi:hypothetical protein
METTIAAPGVMEGNGAYNRYAKLPADGAALATPFLEAALKKIALEPGHQPIVIADYGSSQGKNSLAPMQVAIRSLRTRIGADRAISVFHIDQPANDFNSLFGVLSSDPGRYSRNDDLVYPCAIGKSFYGQVLPSNSVHLAWSSYAVVWLSRIPCLIPGHIFPPRSTGEVRAAFERQGAKDWETFLSLRAREMRPGARLVVVLPTLPRDGSTGFAGLIDHANEVLGEMVEEGSITADERAAMVLGSYPRRKEELLAPFKNGEFQNLILEECEIFELPDTAWAAYRANGDAHGLAHQQASFFRAAFVPSLASALTTNNDDNGEVILRFADSFRDRLVRHVAGHPAPYDTCVEICVFAKSG